MAFGMASLIACSASLMVLLIPLDSPLPTALATSGDRPAASNASCNPSPRSLISSVLVVPFTSTVTVSPSMLTETLASSPPPKSTDIVPPPVTSASKTSPRWSNFIVTSPPILTSTSKPPISSVPPKLPLPTPTPVLPSPEFAPTLTPVPGIATGVVGRP